MIKDAFNRDRKNPKAPYKKVDSGFDYPQGYGGPKELEEQATILREQYSFPLKPLAKVKKIPNEAEGLWIIPHLEWIAPPECEHPYNYCVDFLLERIGWKHQLKNFHPDKTGHSYLRQYEQSLSRWNILKILQGGGKLTPVVPAQFGRMHKDETVDYVRKNALDNEILFGAYHVGVMLLTHPEREQIWEQLHINCPGDKFRFTGGHSHFSQAPFFAWSSNFLNFGFDYTKMNFGRWCSVTGFIPRK